MGTVWEGIKSGIKKIGVALMLATVVAAVIVPAFAASPQIGQPLATVYAGLTVVGSSTSLMACTADGVSMVITYYGKKGQTNAESRVGTFTWTGAPYPFAAALWDDTGTATKIFVANKAGIITGIFNSGDEAGDPCDYR